MSSRSTSTGRLIAYGGCAILATIGIIGSPPAAAQGTAVQRMACMSDAMALCASDIPNEARIAACLRRERARVSPACVDQLDAATRSASLRQ